MVGKQTEPLPQKAVRLSTDAYPEDAELISQLMENLNLDSRKEAIHTLCDHYRGESESEGKEEELNCDFRIKEGLSLFCAKNSEKTKKTTIEKCNVCLKAQRIAKRQEKLEEIRALGERERQYTGERFEFLFFQRLGVDVHLYLDKVSRIQLAEKYLDKQDAELRELKKPIESTLKELAEVKSQNATLETDNSFLRQQLDELKKDPLAEKCAWQSIELTNKDQEIKKLNALITSQEATISAYMFGKGKTP